MSEPDPQEIALGLAIAEIERLPNDQAASLATAAVLRQDPRDLPGYELISGLFVADKAGSPPVAHDLALKAFLIVAQRRG